MSSDLTFLPTSLVNAHISKVTDTPRGIFSPRGNVEAIARSGSMQINIRALQNLNPETPQRSISTPHNGLTSRIYTPHNIQHNLSESSTISTSEEDEFDFTKWSSDVREVVKQKKNRNRSSRIEIISSESFEVRSAERWNNHLKLGIENSKLENSKTSLLLSSSSSASSLKSLFASKSFHAIFKANLEKVNVTLPRFMTSHAIDDIIDMYMLELIKGYRFDSNQTYEISELIEDFSEVIVKYLKEKDILIYPIVERAIFLKHPICDLNKKTSKKKHPSETIVEIADLKSSKAFLIVWEKSPVKHRKYILELIHLEEQTAMEVMQRIIWWLGPEGQTEVKRKVGIFLRDYIDLSNSCIRRYGWNGEKFKNTYSPFKTLRWQDASRMFTTSSSTRELVDNLDKRYLVNGESIHFKEPEKSKLCSSLFRQFFKGIMRSGLKKNELTNYQISEKEKKKFSKTLLDYLSFMSSSIFEESVLTVPLIIMLKPTRLDEFLQYLMDSLFFLETRETALNKALDSEYYYDPDKLITTINNLEVILQANKCQNKESQDIILEELKKNEFITNNIDDEKIDINVLAQKVNLDYVKYNKILNEILALAKALKCLHILKSILLGLLYSPEKFLACIRPREELNKLLENPEILSQELKKNQTLKSLLNNNLLVSSMFSNPIDLTKIITEPNNKSDLFNQLLNFIPTLVSMSSYMESHPDAIIISIHALLDIFLMTTTTGSWAGPSIFREEKSRLFTLWDFKTLPLEKCNITIDERGEYSVAHFFRCTNEQAKKETLHKATEFFLVSELMPSISAEGKLNWQGVIHVPFLSRGLTKLADTTAQWQVDRKLRKQPDGKTTQLSEGLEIREDSKPLEGSNLRIIQEYAGLV